MPWATTAFKLLSRQPLFSRRSDPRNTRRSKPLSTPAIWSLYFSINCSMAFSCSVFSSTWFKSTEILYRKRHTVCGKAALCHGRGNHEVNAAKKTLGLRGGLVRLPSLFRHLLPGPDISNALFEASDDHFHAACKLVPVVAANRGSVFGAVTGEDHLACSALTDGGGNLPENTNHLVIRRIHGSLFALQIKHQISDQGRTRQAGEHGQRQDQPERQERMAGQQVPRAAEPGEEYRDCAGIQEAG